MKLNIILKLVFAILVLSQISMGFLIKVKRNTREKTNCDSSACGWSIEKKNGQPTEYVENNCKCRSDERCLRTVKEYRLDGYKFHCKKPDEVRYSSDIFVFPIPDNNPNNQSDNSGNADD